MARKGLISKFCSLFEGIYFYLSTREYIQNWDFQYYIFDFMNYSKQLTVFIWSELSWNIFSVLIAWDIWSTVCNFITNTHFSLHGSLNLILIFQVHQLLLHIPFWINCQCMYGLLNIIVGTFILTQIVFSYSIDNVLYYSFVDPSGITILIFCIYWTIWIAGNPKLNDGFNYKHSNAYFGFNKVFLISLVFFSIFYESWLFYSVRFHYFTWG